jgi:hypothetical protein
MLLSRLRQMIFTGLAYRSTQQHKTGEANGCRHGEMSRDRTRHPYELLITQEDFASPHLSHVLARMRERRLRARATVLDIAPAIVSGVGGLLMPTFFIRSTPNTIGDAKFLTSLHDRI